MQGVSPKHLLPIWPWLGSFSFVLWASLPSLAPCTVQAKHRSLEGLHSCRG